jgi:hypothetical protein
MKLLWAREEYVTCCSRKDGSGIAWSKTGIRKLRGTRKGSRMEEAAYVRMRKTLCVFS